MQKNLKRALAFLMTVILIFSVIPMSAFAAESAPDETASTEAPTSEPPAERDSTTEVSPELNVTDEPVLPPETGPSSPGDEPAGAALPAVPVFENCLTIPGACAIIRPDN